MGSETKRGERRNKGREEPRGNEEKGREGNRDEERKERTDKGRWKEGREG